MGREDLGPGVSRKGREGGIVKPICNEGVLFKNEGILLIVAGDLGEGIFQP